MAVNAPISIAIARPELGTAEEAAVIEVMRSGALAQGRKVRAFEEAYAAATGAEYAIATSNGSTALFLALLAHGVGPGDEVITTPLTFIASGNAIVQTGARPVFADVDGSLNLDPNQVESLIGPRTRAIMPVHLHGNPFDVGAFKEIAERHRLPLIQDACQAHGATVGGRPLGHFGTAAYSFYATKNISTGGEGGMVITSDPEVARLIGSLRHQGYAPSGNYLHDRIGYNFRMTEIQAAIGLVQLDKLNGIVARRRSNAAFYDSTIDWNRYQKAAVLPDAVHVYHQYVIRVPSASEAERDRVRRVLEQAGIGTGVHYPIPLHLQPAYREFENGRFPNAERAAQDMISIPVHPGLTVLDLERVAEALNQA